MKQHESIKDFYPSKASIYNWSIYIQSHASIQKMQVVRSSVFTTYLKQRHSHLGTNPGNALVALPSLRSNTVKLEPAGLRGPVPPNERSSNPELVHVYN